MIGGAVCDRSCGFFPEGKEDILSPVGTRNVIENLMREALSEAEKSRNTGEVPVGCIITDGSGTIIGRGHNSPVASTDPTAHGEMIALRDAAKKQGNYRLPGCLAFVTLEPCPMCAGALVHARIARVYFGTKDPKGGGLVSNYGIGTDGKLNHEIEVVGGILEEECQRLLKEFFRAKR